MRQLAIALGDHISKKYLGPFLKSYGIALDEAGVKLTKYDYVEKFRVIPTENAIPQLSQANFVAPNAATIGDVTLGKDASLWYNAVLRGDLNKIEIGSQSIIQDGVVIKPSKGPTKIGRNVFVGPNSRLGSCTLQDFSFVSMGSVVDDDCVVESYGMLAAGSTLQKGARVPSGQIWAGNPATFLREVTAEERESITEHLSEMRSLAAIHSEETEKTFEQVFKDDALKERQFYLSWSESFWEKFERLGGLDHPVDSQEPEVVKNMEYFNIFDRERTHVYDDKSWKPFTEDAAVFPESWKIYGEDMNRYERAKKMFEEPTPQRPLEYEDTLAPQESTAWVKRY